MSATPHMNGPRRHEACDLVAHREGKRVVKTARQGFQGPNNFEINCSISTVLGEVALKSSEGG